MAITSTDIPQIVINKMSTSKYEELKTAGQLVDNEFYITPDGGTIPEVNNDTNQQVLSNNGTDLLWRDEQIGYKQISNCITEIPQDIKLELNSDYSITLKAGSKLYIPNGFETDGTTKKFDEVIIESDITNTRTGSELQEFLFGTNNSLNFWRYLYSGDTAPSEQQHMVWYDTANNIIKYTTDTGSTWINSGFSLPLCIYTRFESGIKSIDQVFNGFGFIGSTLFILPGVEGLAPNGRNEDGTLNNTIIKSSAISTRLIGSSNYNTKNVLYFNGSNSIGIQLYKNYYLDKEKNLLAEINNDGTFNRYIGGGTAIVGGEFICDNSKIISLKSYTTYQAVDRNDSSWIAQQSMPSNKYIDLSLGATGTTYTAPANGWFMFDGQGPTWIDAAVSFQNGPHYGYCYKSRESDNYTRLLIPVQKGAVLLLQYDSTVTNLIQFRFIYAQGEL